MPCILLHQDDDIVYSSWKQEVLRYAKTLYKSTAPKETHDRIMVHSKEPLPYFFKYAKDKTDKQICARNSSFVNKLDTVIPDTRINLNKLGLGKIDYTLLMHNPDVECRVQIGKGGKLIEELTDPLIVRFNELNKKYHYKVNVNFKDFFSPDITPKTEVKESMLYQSISNEIRTELLYYNSDEQEIADILIKYVYGIRQSKHKMTLWLCYGQYIYENLLDNGFKKETKEVQCMDCGKWFEVPLSNRRVCRCEDCQHEARKIQYLESKKRNAE